MSALKDVDILTKEIVSWKGFEYALRQPNATLFNNMLTECLANEEYAAAFKTKGPQDSAESLFMVLTLTEDDKQINRKNTEQSKEEKLKVSLSHIPVVCKSIIESI
jgi:hypothetical protein